jgi:dTMP kinase
MAARRDHVTRLIEPSLAQGIWVISDRFADSTLAYQGYGKGLPLADLAALQRLALGAFAPELTLILDLPVEIGLARAAGRGAATDRFEGLDAAFHERMREGFRQIAAQDEARCVLLDASLEPESVHRAVLTAVERRLSVTMSSG